MTHRCGIGGWITLTVEVVFAHLPQVLARSSVQHASGGPRGEHFHVHGDVPFQHTREHLFLCTNILTWKTVPYANISTGIKYKFESAACQQCVACDWTKENHPFVTVKCVSHLEVGGCSRVEGPRHVCRAVDVLRSRIQQEQVIVGERLACIWLGSVFHRRVE